MDSAGQSQPLQPAVANVNCIDRFPVQSGGAGGVPLRTPSAPRSGVRRPSRTSSSSAPKFASSSADDGRATPVVEVRSIGALALLAAPSLLLQPDNVHFPSGLLQSSSNHAFSPPLNVGLFSAHWPSAPISYFAPPQQRDNAAAGAGAPSALLSLVPATMMRFSCMQDPVGTLFLADIVPPVAAAASPAAIVREGGTSFAASPAGAAAALAPAPSGAGGASSLPPRAPSASGGPLPSQRQSSALSGISLAASATSGAYFDRAAYANAPMPHSFERLLAPPFSLGTAGAPSGVARASAAAPSAAAALAGLRTYKVHFGRGLAKLPWGIYFFFTGHKELALASSPLAAAICAGPFDSSVLSAGMPSGTLSKPYAAVVRSVEAPSVGYICSSDILIAIDDEDVAGISIDGSDGSVPSSAASSTPKPPINNIQQIISARKARLVNAVEEDVPFPKHVTLTFATLREA